jgi:secreted Zn-dependent insulinase-like peptidase
VLDCKELQYGYRTTILSRIMSSEKGISSDFIRDCLNETKSPLDKKLYRNVLLPNGLRVLLIQDTPAMHQLASEARYDHLHDDEEEDDEDEEKEEDINGNEQDKKEGNEKGSGRLRVRDSKILNGDAGSMADSDTEGGDDDDDDDGEEEEEGGIRKAAAAMVVGAGSFHDPSQCQGLAHFCEHMLFMGTEKYPVENSYDSFLTQHGGSDNAFTEYEHTVYYFDIPQEELEEALDRFAQFFIAPLFSKDSVEREVQAIESEFQLSKNSDGSRLERLMQHTGKQMGKHPQSTFSWGNQKSLVDEPKANGVDILKELRTFFNQFYHATNMRLVVIGAYELDELEEEVLKCFSEVPSDPRESHPFQWKKKNSTDTDKKASDWMTWNVENVDSPLVDVGMPFPPSSLATLYRMVPVKDRHQIGITWQIPPQKSAWRTKSYDYLAHLLGHESKGSILSTLKGRGGEEGCNDSKCWVTSCSAGVDGEGYSSASCFALFSVTFTLTEEGVRHWKEVVSTLFTYIGMLRHHLMSNDGMPDYIYNEMKTILELSHKYQEEESPDDFVEQLAERMSPENDLHFPPERLLDFEELLFGYDKEGVERLVEHHLTPKNARYDLMSSLFGRAADYESNYDAAMEQDSTSSELDPVKGCSTVDAFHVGGTTALPSPSVEPWFGTHYWRQDMSSTLIAEWQEAAKPSLPSVSSNLSLPPVNQFVPTNLQLKPRPLDDTHHPLLRCSLKILVLTGKKKEWYPATVTKYNSVTNLLELVYEDFTAHDHACDMNAEDRQKAMAMHSQHRHQHHDFVWPDMDGTFDLKKTKFKVVHVPKAGEGAGLKYGDETDFRVELGTAFPPIPPPTPASRLPCLVVDQSGIKMWHLQDTKFHRPLAELRLKIKCGNANKSPLERTCADLMASLCRDALEEVSYMAAVCELGSSLKSDDTGFSIRVHGFDDRLLELTKEVLSVFFSFRTASSLSSRKLPPSVAPSRFGPGIEVLQRSYANTGMTAGKMCSDIRLRCIRTTIWSAYAKAQALKDNMTIERFMAVVQTFMDKISIEGLFHGNCSKEDAKLAFDLIHGAMTTSSSSNGNYGSILSKKKHPLQPVLHVIPCTTASQHKIVAPTLDPTDPNTAVEIYFQVGRDDLKQRVIIDLLCQVLSEPLFDQVRTKDQFGYEVYCAPRWTYGIMGISFKCVTASKSAAEVDERFDRFVVDFRSDLVTMPHEEFAQHLAGLAKNKLQMFNTLEEECSSYWDEIVDGRYDWECHRSETLQLKGLAKADILKMFDEILMPTRSSDGALQKKRRLVVQVIGTSEGEASKGRPAPNGDADTGISIDDLVKDYHNKAGGSTWGKIM